MSFVRLPLKLQEPGLASVSCRHIPDSQQGLRQSQYVIIVDGRQR